MTCGLAVLGTVMFASTQQKPPAINTARLLTRTATRHEILRLAYGGTVTIVGAPQGSITVRGWGRSELELTAGVELRAETEADLDRLAAVNGFVFDEDADHLRILTTGMHDKVFLGRVAKDFPKRLLGLPWKIDYEVQVPVLTDLEINTGRGPIEVTSVEGAIQVSADESEMHLTLTGGTVSATIGLGRAELRIPVRSWRGSGADIRIATGNLTVELPPGFNGDIDAVILRSGHIEDTYGALRARESQGITSQIVKARAGAGGASFQFTVGEGTIYIKKIALADQ